MQIYHETIGEGPVIVFNHGWTMSHHLFKKQAPLFKEFQVVLWDLPGHGDSEKRASGYTLADCALALHELIQKLDLHDITAFGWSMGANVFWEYLSRYGKERIQRMIAIDSIPWGVPERFQVPAVEKSFARDKAHATRKFIKSMFHEKPPESEVDWIFREAEKVPSEIALKYYREIAESDYREIARQMNIPQCYWMGRFGYHQEQIAALQSDVLPYAIQFFENSAHVPFLEEHELFNRMILELD